MQSMFGAMGIKGRIAGIVAAGALALSAHAAPISFDPDGAGAANGTSTIGGLDWSVGNSLDQGLIVPTPGATFQQYYHATLAGLINTNGTTIAPAGLNSTFEITVVASVTQTVTGVFGNTYTHALSAVQSPNSFFEIWFDSTPDANNLAGTGFNDGTRIMVGAANPASPNNGNFSLITTVGGGPLIEGFDQFGTDNYGISSFVGSGGEQYRGPVSTFDPAFFVSGASTFLFNTSMITPFLETEPSALFAGLPSGVAPAVVPARGAINGSSGPDFQQQSDANMTFTPIPEPGSVALTLLAAGTLLRRRAR